MANRPKPYTLSGDPTSETVERIDEMFSTLYTDTGPQGSHALLSSSHSDTTPATVTRGAIITGQGVSALWTLLVVGSANTFLRSNGVDVAYAAVTLSSADVTGTLGVTNGGTGLATFAQGDLIYGSAANTLSALAKNASASRYLSNSGSSNNPAWAQVDLTNGVTGILPVGNGGTGAANYTKGTFHGSTGSVTVAAGATLYMGPGEGNASEASARFPIPIGATVKNLYCRADQVPGVGQTYTYNVYLNGGSSGINCQTAGNASNTSSDLSHTASLSAGGFISIRVDVSGGAAAAQHFCVVELSS